MIVVPRMPEPMEISVRSEDIGIGERTQRLGQAEGGDGSARVAGESQDFAFAGGRQPFLAEIAAQFSPVDLLRAGDQGQDELLLREAEEQAADDLLRLLAAFAGGLFQGFDGAGMDKDTVGDIELVEGLGDRCVHKGIIEKYQRSRRFFVATGSWKSTFPKS